MYYILYSRAPQGEDKRQDSIVKGANPLKNLKNTLKEKDGREGPLILNCFFGRF